MYFLKDDEELIGKEIAFIDLGYLDSEITIATKDGGIIQIEYGDEEYYPIRSDVACHSVIESSSLLAELKKLKIVTDRDVQKYKEKLKKEQERKHEQWLKQKEKGEYMKYLRLKEKYEGGK